MTSDLLALRLTGALSLREGRLVARTVAFAGGRLTTGPLPEVDLSGFYVLPGIVDMHATGFERHLTGDASGLALIDGEAASHGVTTRWLSQPWSWERRGAAPEAAAALARSLAARRRQGLTDLRLQLACETLMTGAEAELLDLVRAAGIDQVIFSNRAARLRELRRRDGEAFAREAWRLGTEPAALGAALDAALVNAAAVPRHLCRLAEAFDAMGVVYGSAGDVEAETREHYSMLGARLCLDPGGPRVAAAARAVGDPVLASADGVLHPAPGAGVRTMALIQAGLCNALVSGPHSAAPLQAAFRLAERGIVPLEQAWALVSERPAAIMRLPDRGRIAPRLRADLAIVNAATLAVEATICGGRLTYLAGEAAARFMGARGTVRLAAE